MSEVIQYWHVLQWFSNRSWMWVYFSLLNPMHHNSRTGGFGEGP